MDKKIVLFDIDYTLFNTTKFKELIAQELKKYFPKASIELLEEVYGEVRKYGAFNPSLFAQFFTHKTEIQIPAEAVEKLWFDRGTIEKSLYPEVLSTLSILQNRKDTVFGIFSSGHTDFQLRKISMVSDFFAKEHMHIAPFKEETLQDVLHEYRNASVVLVDDLITILQKAKSLKPTLFSIWIKRGKFAERAEIPSGFIPDVTVSLLSEIPDILDNLTI